MQVTNLAAELTCVSPPLPSVLEAGAALVVLSARRWKPPELKMPLVQHPVAVGLGFDPGPASGRVDQADHHGGRMPLTSGNSGIQVAKAGSQ